MQWIICRNYHLLIKRKHSKRNFQIFFVSGYYELSLTQFICVTIVNQFMPFVSYYRGINSVFLPLFEFIYLFYYCSLEYIVVIYVQYIHRYYSFIFTKIIGSNLDFKNSIETRCWKKKKKKTYLWFRTYFSLCY